MKKITLALILCVTLLTACSAKSVSPGGGSTAVPSSTRSTGPSPSPSLSPSPSPSTTTAVKVSDYFGFTKDVHMIYKGTGNEYAGYETYVDYVKDGVMQIRNINAGTVMVIVYQLKNGALKKVYTQGEAYYRYDCTTLTNDDEILIKEPIKEGTSWKLKDGSVRSITSVDRQVKTPAGDFRTLEITTKRQNSTEKDYYARNTGLVKKEYKSGSDPFSITSELEKIENNVPFKHNVRFYFPEFSKSRVVYIDREVEIYTNQDMKFKFQKELKTIPQNSGLSKVLTPNVQVLGCSIDDKKGIVTVDFSSNLVRDMNAGTSFESMILTSIVNTFGGYYQKDKVIITMAGKLYESGHILLKQGEYFTVKKDNISEYKKP